MRDTTRWPSPGLLLAALMLIGWAASAAAQGTGRVTGTATAPDGARLPGATIVLTRGDGQAARLASGPAGDWRSPELPAGAYRISASLPGFATRELSATVEPGRETRVELVLAVAGVSETVSVLGTAPRAALEASEIREIPARDAGDALGWKPGLWRLRKGAIANDVVLRGLQSRDINVLIDGQRVYGACPNHMDPAAFHVDLSEIDRVDVGVGPFDVKNAGGLGGTVNVVTRRPEPGWHASPSLSVSSFATVNPALTVSRGGARVSALAGYSWRQGDPPKDGAGRRFTELANYRPERQDDHAFEVGSAWGRLILTPKPKHAFDLSYSRQDAGAILYPYLMMDASFDDTDRANLRYEATGLGARQASVRVQGYLTRVDHWMTDERRTSSEGKPRAWSMATRADTRTLGGKAETVLGGLTLGVEAHERRWDATNEMAGFAYAPQAMVPDVGVRIAGVFVEYERVLRQGLALSAGARFDQARSEADGSRANVALYEAYQGTRRLEASDTLPAGKLRVAWRRGAWQLAAGLGHAARVPEATERWIALRRAGSDWVGNPGLEPSRNTGLDASVEWTRSGFRLTANGYRSRVRDYITVYDQARRTVGVTPNAMARSFANVDATLVGGELVGSLPILFGRVFVSADVSYVRGQQDGDAARGIIAGPLAEMPPLRGRVSARYDDGLLFGSVEGVFAADQERVDVSLNEASTPGWGILNVSAGVRKGRLRATAGVANAFDRFYTDHLSYQRDPFRSGVKVPEPGRSLYLNLSTTF